VHKGGLLEKEKWVACRLKESVMIIYSESVVFQSSLHPTFLHLPKERIRFVSD
jgi:hypothetical protein